jgi:hypothetical protein
VNRPPFPRGWKNLSILRWSTVCCPSPCPAAAKPTSALAGRAQDVLDIEGIVARQGNALGLAYVRRWLTELSRVSDDPELTVRFERAWAAYGPGR